jgi:hypothetical protein
MKLRRIRAGKGFLPAQRANQKEGDWTGVMMRRRREWGLLTVGPMIEPDQVKPVGETEEEQRANFEEYAIGVREAYRREREALEEEERLAKMIDAGGAIAHLAHLEKKRRGRALRLVT